MLYSSISASVAYAIQYETALTVISSNKTSLFFSESFLESLRPSITVSVERMTAAAKTGPARGPLPASSTPHREVQPFS